MWLLYEALAYARAEVKAVKSDATYKGKFTFRYTSTEAILEATTRLMAIHGLSLYRQSFSLDRVLSEDDGVLMLNSTFMLTHKSGGKEVLYSTWPIIPIGDNPLDKALAAALTSSLGYMLRDILGVPRDDVTDDIQGREDGPKTEVRETLVECLGTIGASRLRGKLHQLSILPEDLVTAVRTFGIDLPDRFEFWPVTLLPRIDLWCEARVKARSAPKVTMTEALRGSSSPDEAAPSPGEPKVVATEPPPKEAHSVAVRGSPKRKRDTSAEDATGLIV
jgi:hypothetical protein